MSTPGAPTDGARRANIIGLVVVAALSALLLGMVARVAQLQLKPDDNLRAFLQPRTSKASEIAPRGDLLDRRGRVLFASRIGERVFVDPTRFAQPYDQSLATLARALGVDKNALADKIFPVIAKNEHRAALGEPLIRYVKVTEVLDDYQIDAIKAATIPGVHFEKRPVREGPGADLAAMLIGRVDIDHSGQFGAERQFDPALRGADGSLRYVRDSRGRPLWLQPGGYAQPSPGHDLLLSIDARIQEIAEQELDRGVDEANAQGGRIVVVDPATGELLAVADIVRDMTGKVVPWGKRPVAGGLTRRSVIKPDPNRAIAPSAGRNRNFTDLYEPGSTFKPFVWSIVTDGGYARPDEVFHTGGKTWITSYGRPIRDVVPKDSQTWREVLSNSSNIGMSQASERVPFAVLRNGLTNFGFGSTTGLRIPGERPGYLTPPAKWSRYTQTSVSFGQEVLVTTAQMARAFCVFARQGELAGTLPALRLTAADDASASAEQTLHRVIPWDVAATARLAMVRVMEASDRRMVQKKMDVTFNYVLFGKSGTAQVAVEGERGYIPDQYIASFVAAGPVHSPRLVVVTVIDDPGPEQVRRLDHRGSAAAAPVCRRVLERSLEYLGVQPSIEPVVKPHPGSTSDHTAEARALSADPNAD